jgi:hypothetical protein
VLRTLSPSWSSVRWLLRPGHLQLLCCRVPGRSEKQPYRKQVVVEKCCFVPCPLDMLRVFKERYSPAQCTAESTSKREVMLNGAQAAEVLHHSSASTASKPALQRATQRTNSNRLCSMHKPHVKEVRRSLIVFLAEQKRPKR